MNTGRAVRLSRFVLFIDHGAEVEVQHTVRGTSTRVARSIYDALLGYRGFLELEKADEHWVDVGVLVPPFVDSVEHHGGLKPRTEALLARAHEDWYWAREVEAERSYRWLGHSVVKMPSDLFFYQELITERGLDSVLEIGYGRGGGLWFFASVLANRPGSFVVGVDCEIATEVPPFGRFRDVRVELVHGCGHDVATVDAVRTLRPSGFGLVVVDADPRPEGKLALLERWAPLVGSAGYLVVEDVGTPECVGAGVTPEGIDRFLLAHRDFGISPDAARFPLLKSRGAVLQALPGRTDR